MGVGARVQMGMGGHTYSEAEETEEGDGVRAQAPA